MKIQHLRQPVDTIRYYMFTDGMTPRPSPAGKIEVEMITRDAATEMPKFRATHRGFVVEGTLQVDADQGRMRLVGLVITSSDPSLEITSTVLREIEIAKLVQAGKNAAAKQATWFLPEPDGVTSRQGWQASFEDNEQVRRMRARIKAASRSSHVRGAALGRGDAFYRRVALDLIELVESGKPTPGGVLETLARVEADRLRLSDVPVQTLRTWLRVARERQFLSPGERGRLVAIPGPLLYVQEETS